MAMTLEELKADINQMKDALAVARHQRDHIDNLLNQIGTEFQAVNASWKSPSSATYEDVQAWFNKSAADLRDLLTDSIGRLDSAIKNYVDAETTNFKNLASTPPGGGGGNGTRTSKPGVAAPSGHGHKTPYQPPSVAAPPTQTGSTQAGRPSLGMPSTQTGSPQVNRPSLGILPEIPPGQGGA